MPEGGLLGLDALPEQDILDFLGAPSARFQKAQPSLPVTAAPPVGAPHGPVGRAGGLRLVGAGEGPTGQPGGPGALNTLGGVASALKDIKFSDLASTLFGDQPGGAVQTPSGALTTSAPEALRGQQFPDFP